MKCISYHSDNGIYECFEYVYEIAFLINKVVPQFHITELVFLIIPFCIICISFKNWTFYRSYNIPVFTDIPIIQLSF